MRGRGIFTHFLSIQKFSYYFLNKSVDFTRTQVAPAIEGNAMERVKVQTRLKISLTFVPLYMIPKKCGQTIFEQTNTYCKKFEQVGA